MEKKHNRFLWITTLEMKFSKALEKSVEGFSWKEKADFFELFIQYVRLLKEKDEAVSDFFMEKLMKPFKSKLKTASRERLFSFFFDPVMAWVELEVITTEVFNELPAGEQGMTDEEYDLYLEHQIRYLRNHLYFHYIHAHSEDDETEQNTLEGTSAILKGRPERAAGDNLTKLNQEQTALLIDYLKESRLILKDEYLNAKKAGMAFSMLTGYSPDALRIKLGKKEISKIKTKENLKELDNVLTALKILIDKDIKAQK